MDDEQPELPQLLRVELFVSDVNVMPVRRMVNLTIIDDDIDPTGELLCLLRRTHAQTMHSGCELVKRPHQLTTSDVDHILTIYLFHVHYFCATVKYHYN